MGNDFPLNSEGIMYRLVSVIALEAQGFRSFLCDLILLVCCFLPRWSFGHILSIPGAREYHDDVLTKVWSCLIYCSGYSVDPVTLRNVCASVLDIFFYYSSDFSSHIFFFFDPFS